MKASSDRRSHGCCTVRAVADCSVRVIGCRLPGFSPILFETWRAKTKIVGLNSVLAAHFAPLVLVELVVTRQDFPHWMRPEL